MPRPILNKNVRVERKCPRCHCHGYHWIDHKTLIINCAACGHNWKGRLRDTDV